VIAIKDDGIDKRNVAYGTHQVRIVVGYVFQCSEIHQRFFPRRRGPMALEAIAGSSFSSRGTERGEMSTSTGEFGEKGVKVMLDGVMVVDRTRGGVGVG
jgi:hypothetical protein